MTIAKTIGIVVGAIAAYHVAIGLAVIAAAPWDRPIHARDRALWVVTWPIVLVATNHMQLLATETMESIKETLEEINSGRWERKP